MQKWVDKNDIIEYISSLKVWCSVMALRAMRIRKVETCLYLRPTNPLSGSSPLRGVASRPDYIWIRGNHCLGARPSGGLLPDKFL